MSFKFFFNSHSKHTQYKSLLQVVVQYLPKSSLFLMMPFLFGRWNGTICIRSTYLRHIAPVGETTAVTHIVPPIMHLLRWVSVNWQTLQNSTQCPMKLWTFGQPPEWSIEYIYILDCSSVDEWQCFWTIILINRCKSWITFQYVWDEPNMPKTKLFNCC